MGKNWAIVIGINQYRNLQPLQFAVRDAQLMSDYFRNEVSFQQVYYFTDDSPPIAQDYGSPLDSTPTFTTLNRFLRTRFEQRFLETGDNLWFFFAGHGIRYEDRDYLLPLDGDPGDVERSAIPISYLTERLRRSGADNIVLLLDACRNQGGRAGIGVGEEVPQGVVTLFSCSPRESSYEIEALQQGAFTHTVLQALRLQGEGNCATVERLDQFLHVQVPAVNRRYGKPNQTPYASVEPAAKYHLILLPRQATPRDAETLKMEAYKAETEREVELAEQLWIRVLAVSPADSDAINGIRRLAQVQPELTHPRQESRLPTQSRSSSQEDQTVTSSPPFVLTRRHLLWLGLGGAGASSVLLVKALLPIISSNSARESSTPTTPSLPSTSSNGSAPVKSPSVSQITRLQPFEFDVVRVNAQGIEIKRQRGKAEALTEDLGSGINLEMVSIAGGTFQMGSPAGEKAREDREEQHPVTVKPFFTGKYAVIQSQWKAVAGLPQVKQTLDPNPSRFKGANRPVEQVTWKDAVEFCDRLSRKTGRQYRLPSETEWEYVCRAGTTTPFYFGETITTDLANYRGTDNPSLGGSGSYGQEPKGIYREQTTNVGSFPPNAYGLYDMHGNVWEWCLDYWHENYEGAPTNGSTWVTDGDSNRRLLRGGSWSRNPQDCRSAFRNSFGLDGKYVNIGFRVVCTL